MILDPLVGLVEHGQRKVVLARFVGKVAVDRAFGELRDRLVPEPRSAVPVIETIAMSTAEDPAPSSSDPRRHHRRMPIMAMLRTGTNSCCPTTTTCRRRTSCRSWPH